MSAMVSSFKTNRFFEVSSKHAMQQRRDGEMERRDHSGHFKRTNKRGSSVLTTAYDFQQVSRQPQIHLPMAARGDKFKVNMGNNPTVEKGRYRACTECQVRKTRVSLRTSYYFHRNTHNQRSATYKTERVIVVLSVQHMAGSAREGVSSI